MALAISNLIAHAPEFHDSTQKDDPETTATDKTEPVPAATPTETEKQEAEVGDRPTTSPSNQQPVPLVTIPPKKPIPNLETTFGVISFLAVLTTPLILLSLARKK